MKKLISTLNTSNVSDAIRSKMNFTIKVPINPENTKSVQQLQNDTSFSHFELIGIAIIYDDTVEGCYIIDFTEEEDAFLTALKYF